MTLTKDSVPPTLDIRATTQPITRTIILNGTYSDTTSGVAAVDVSVAPNKTVVTEAINKFVSAFNAINQTLNELTKYDAGTKTAGLLQGDSTAIGLQSALRGGLQSTTAGSAYKRLADIGVTQQLGGDLAVDSTKLSAALANGDEVKNLFRIDNSNTLTNGVALKPSALGPMANDQAGRSLATLSRLI